MELGPEHGQLDPVHVEFGRVVFDRSSPDRVAFRARVGFDPDQSAIQIEDSDL